MLQARAVVLSLNAGSDILLPGYNVVDVEELQLLLLEPRQRLDQCVHPLMLLLRFLSNRTPGNFEAATPWAAIPLGAQNFSFHPTTSFTLLSTLAATPTTVVRISSVTPRRALPCNFMLKYPPRAEQGLATSLSYCFSSSSRFDPGWRSEDVADVVVDIKSPDLTFRLLQIYKGPALAW